MDEKENGNDLLESVYLDMYHFLYNYANSRLKDPSMAEEAVQETFRIACCKLEAFRASPNPKGWIVLTLKNVLRNMIRSRARLLKAFITMDENSISNLEAPPEAGITDAEYSDILSPDDYELIKLVEIEGFAINDAAEHFGISVEACKKRVQRATERLRKGLSIKKKTCPPNGAAGQGESEGLQGV